MSDILTTVVELFDCDWGCGCGFDPSWEHAHKPCDECVSCRLAQAQAENAHLRAVVEAAKALACDKGCTRHHRGHTLRAALSQLEGDSE